MKRDIPELLSQHKGEILEEKGNTLVFQDYKNGTCPWHKAIDHSCVLSCLFPSFSQTFLEMTVCHSSL